MDDHYRRLLEQHYGGRRWVLAVGVLPAATALIEQLRQLGAEAVFVVAGGRGTGPVPDDVPTTVLDTGGADVMDQIRRFGRALGDLPPATTATTAALDAFDPERRARVIGDFFVEHSHVAGRAVQGARRAAWQALEDKTTVDALWDDAGVTRAATRVVPAALATLRVASAQLDRGRGVVWAADNRRGWHGGARSLRWVATPQQASDAAAFMVEHADRVRVMPFLDGVPCSIHGVVFDDATAVFRPCEMVVLRRPGRGDLLYVGTSST